MNLLTSLRNQLPLFVMLSPVIGFFATYVASRFERNLIRPLAISNCICTLLILGGVAWQFESDLSDNAAVLRLVETVDSNSNQMSNSRMAVYEQIDRRRVERLRHQVFAIDGTNLWPTLALIVLTGLIIWQTERSVGQETDFVPTVLLFESASIAALTAYDLRAFLLASGICALLMSLLIGRWGGLDRRGLSGRFLFAQLCGNSVVMFGFAMLAVAVPWLKLDVSTKLPPISWNIATIVYEVQKWTGRNELAFQYQDEVFPWMLFILSAGFAIQFGLFPFHSWQSSVLSAAPPGISVLCLAGIFPIGSLGWLRFVVPLAPELLAQFDWLILIPSAGGAIWGGLRALAASKTREQATYIFLSLSGFSLLGCYSFTTIGMSGAWLMQQQLVLAFCVMLLASVPPVIMTSTAFSVERSFQSRFTTRTQLLLLCILGGGLFATSAMILPQMLRESLLLVAVVFTVSLLLCSTLLVLLSRHFSDEPRGVESSAGKSNLPLWPIVIVVSLAIIVNFVPSFMLHQCEPEFDRVFHRIERLP